MLSVFPPSSSPSKILLKCYVPVHALNGLQQKNWSGVVVNEHVISLPLCNRLDSFHDYNVYDSHLTTPDFVQCCPDWGSNIFSIILSILGLFYKRKLAKIQRKLLRCRLTCLEQWVAAGQISSLCSIVIASNCVY